MKVLFMGTPDFAVTSLMALSDAGHYIPAVVTMPDRPKGRGHKMTHTPVYEAGESIGATVYTPESIKEEFFGHVLREINPDVIVVVAYGKILPPYILEYPKYGCINVHASLLPKYRGAAPIQRAIIDGERITGVTTMFMEKGLDTGDMLFKAEVEIDEDDNYEILHDKLAKQGAELIVSTLDALSNGSCKSEKQDDALSTYAHMITKETAHINWNNSAADIHNLVRGLYPVPKAYTFYGDKLMKICLTKMSDKTSDKDAGTIISKSKSSFFVSCGDESVIEVLSVQLEGKRMMSVCEFLVGNDIEINLKLGE